MFSKIVLLLIFVSVVTNLKCTNKIATTECENVKLSDVQPLQIDSYKTLVKLQGRNQEISAGVFRLLPDATTLYLSFNGIKKLEPGAFSGLHKLIRLILNHNEIEIMPAGLFRDIPSLLYLDLGANRIQHIADGAFDNLSKLEELVLSFNQLDVVPQSLQVLPNLRLLNLANNKIKSVGELRGLPKLEVLNLESNQIRRLDTTKLTTLKELNVKDNYLTDLDVGPMLGLKIIKLNINDFPCSTLRSLVNDLLKRGVMVAEGFATAPNSVKKMTCKN